MYLPFIFLLAAATTHGFAASSKNEHPHDLVVSGWDHPPLQLDTPPRWLGDDALLGRLICPPFSRVNLKKGVSDSLIFHTVRSFKKGSGLVWSYEIRGGLHWWNGGSVLPREVAEFIRRRLSTSIRHRFGDLVHAPAFSVQVKGAAVEVTWAVPPVFGPYILNGEPFYKPARSSRAGFRYMCAGIYQPKVIHASAFELVPTPGYRFPRPSLWWGQAGKKNHSRSLKFKWASSQEVGLQQRSPLRRAPCHHLIDTPWATVMEWTNTTLAKNRTYRKLFASRIPRKSLLSAGAGYWGSSDPSLVPLGHPGFNRSLKPNYLNRANFEKRLKSLGFNYIQETRKFYSQAKRSNLSLNISSSLRLDEPALPRKVILDEFTASGVDVKLVDASRSDVRLSGYYLPLPEMDLLADFHSKNRSADLLAFSVRRLDQLLERYALSLTFHKPSFQVLRKIQEILLEIEPVSIVVRHQVCLVPSKGWKLGQIDTIDPDWFRKLIL